VSLGERSRELVVKQIGDETSLLEGPDGSEAELPNALLPENLTEGQSVRLIVHIESPHTRTEWSRAYAKQGASDLAIYKHLCTRADVQNCHRLHYLQMAGEKIAKAYQFRYTKRLVVDLLSQHVALKEFVNDYCSSKSMKARYAGREAQLQETRQGLLHLATEVEKLAPAVDREKSPTNAEYPWTNGVDLTVPCEAAYSIMSSFNDSVWRNFVQVLADASAELI
jgi:hypothetical protein